MTRPASLTASQFVIEFVWQHRLGICTWSKSPVVNTWHLSPILCIRYLSANLAPSLLPDFVLDEQISKLSPTIELTFPVR